MPRPRRWPREEDGAAAVEFGIMSTLVFMILFGMLSGGLAWNSKQTLTHAAREGARYGATLCAGPGCDSTPTWTQWLDRVAQRTVDSAFGELGDAISGRYVCVAHISPAATINREVGDDRVKDGAPCYADDRPAEESRVQVHAERTTDFQAILFFIPDLRLPASAVARYEVGS